MKRLIVLLFILILTLAGCADKNSRTDDKLHVYTTVFPFKSFIEQIGGTHVNVTSIYPSGADIHTYEPTQKDTMAVANADLFIYSSDELDPVAAKIAKVIKDDNKMLTLASHMKNSSLLEHHHEHSEEHEHENENETALNPHVWLDPVLNESFAIQIKNELIAKDPVNRKDYERNFQSLVSDIKDIDQQMMNITKNPKRDTVYISHESLGYLANRYHFKEVGVSGMNNNEPSQNEIVNMIKDIKSSKTPYIIYEQNISSKITDIIKEDTFVKPLKFHNMSVLTKDDNGATYQTLMKENIKTLDRALND
ncbi:metal ABC transporter solute-binding protein, Zn/Mn family [Macrococcus lamae]|uniref:ABC transporter substrate-binding protein n=1 Tax=Macrococcus lamae TaxID=198484 RepID=A0A4R6BSC3_9STAP|nr:zinc ABC transporter substrate-binding protein [Macrococcus lamae]TDM05262.1 ABC transporter substrate-binding protein [Macrococcus lamae]